VETGFLAAATSHSRLHGRGGLIALQFLRFAHEHGVCIGAVVTGGKGTVSVADLKHHVSIVEQDERVAVPLRHVR